MFTNSKLFNYRFGVVNSNRKVFSSLKYLDDYTKLHPVDQLSLGTRIVIKSKKKN